MELVPSKPQQPATSGDRARAAEPRDGVWETGAASEDDEYRVSPSSTICTFSWEAINTLRLAYLAKCIQSIYPLRVQKSLLPLSLSLTVRQMSGVTYRLRTLWQGGCTHVSELIASSCMLQGNLLGLHSGGSEDPVHFQENPLYRNEAAGSDSNLRTTR